MAMKKPILYIYIARSVHLAFVAARRPPAAVSSSRKVKDGCKVQAWFSEERMQQLGYFSTFIARELRIENVYAFQAPKLFKTVQ